MRPRVKVRKFLLFFRILPQKEVKMRKYFVSFSRNVPRMHSRAAQKLSLAASLYCVLLNVTVETRSNSFFSSSDHTGTK
jgi:hypothetical protein